VPEETPLIELPPGTYRVELHLDSLKLGCQPERVTPVQNIDKLTRGHLHRSRKVVIADSYR
jgi:hypothetical protein